MRILHLIQKDLLQVFKDKKSFIFLLLMPLAFTLFMGYMTAPGNDSDTRIKIGLLNQDTRGQLAPSLETLLASSEVIKVSELSAGDASQFEHWIDNETYAAILIVPPGFSEKTLLGEQPQLELMVDASNNSGQLAVNAIQTVLGKWIGSIQAGIIVSDTLTGGPSVPNNSGKVLEGIDLAMEAWQDPPLTLSMNAVSLGEQVSKEPTGFDQTSPGMIMQFSVLGLITSAMILVLERKNRCLQRLLTTPIQRAGIIAGHMLAMSVVTFFQVLILVLAGQFIFKVNYLNSPFATLLIALALALWTGSLGLLIGALAKKDEQVILFSLIAMFLFTALGGAWFPLEGSSDTFYTLGHFTPLAWAMDGFQNIILRGGGLESVLLPAGILSLYAILFFVLAVWRFKFE